MNRVRQRIEIWPECILARQKLANGEQHATRSSKDIAKLDRTKDFAVASSCTKLRYGERNAKERKVLLDARADHDGRGSTLEEALA